MGRFRKKDTMVEAVQLLWSTWSDVCGLIGPPNEFGAGKFEGCYVNSAGDITDDDTNGRIGLKIPASGPPGTHVLAVESDWIVRGPNGKIYPLSSTRFEREFERVDERESVEYAPDWKRYPHLARVFEHRPAVNVYWEDLRALLVDARADAVQYVHDVRAGELAHVRADEQKKTREAGRPVDAKSAFRYVTNVLLKYEAMLELWPDKPMDIYVVDLTTSVKTQLGMQPKDGQELKNQLLALHGSKEETQYELRFVDHTTRLQRACGLITIPDTRGPANEVRRLTDAQLMQALKNMGVHLEDCDACAEVFFTGSKTHEHTCAKGR